MLDTGALRRAIVIAVEPKVVFGVVNRRLIANNVGLGGEGVVFEGRVGALQLRAL